MRNWNAANPPSLLDAIWMHYPISSKSIWIQRMRHPLCKVGKILKQLSRNQASESSTQPCVLHLESGPRSSKNDPVIQHQMTLGHLGPCCYVSYSDCHGRNNWHQLAGENLDRRAQYLKFLKRDFIMQGKVCLMYGLRDTELRFLDLTVTICRLHKHNECAHGQTWLDHCFPLFTKPGEHHIDSLLGDTARLFAPIFEGGINIIISGRLHQPREPLPVVPPPLDGVNQELFMQFESEVHNTPQIVNVLIAMCACVGDLVGLPLPPPPNVHEASFPLHLRWKESTSTEPQGPRRLCAIMQSDLPPGQIPPFPHAANTPNPASTVGEGPCKSHPHHHGSSPEGLYGKLSRVSRELENNETLRVNAIMVMRWLAGKGGKPHYMSLDSPGRVVFQYGLFLESMWRHVARRLVFSAAMVAEVTRELCQCELDTDVL